MIFVTNASSQLTDKDAALCVAACNAGRAAFARYWTGWAPSWHLILSSSPPRGASVITLMDTPDQANALGWHSIVNGVPMGRVFTRPVLANGGTVLRGRVTVASVLDHEFKELKADSQINLWAFNEADGYLYAYEVCDPVESDEYDVQLPTGERATISNAVTPAWFGSEEHGPFDLLGRLTKPFQMDAGGYLIKSKGGQEVAVYGARYPEWRRELKVRGRTHHRVGELERNRATG